MQDQSEKSTADSISDVGNELLSDASHVGSTAVDRLHSEVDARKGDAVAQAKSVTNAINQAASGLDLNAPTWLKSALESGAQQIQSLTQTIEGKDSRQLVEDVSQFARSSPMTFLGACAAAGFAAARVFKAGGQQDAPRQLPPIGQDATGAGNPQGQFL